MDRPNANIKMCCESIEKKLECPYLLLQTPVVENDKFIGIVDVLSLELLQYGLEKSVKQIELNEKNHPKIWESAKQNRIELIDKLTSFNDELADIVISSDTLDGIKTVDVIKALREVTNSHVSCV